MIPYRRSFIVSADVDRVLEVLSGIGDVFKDLPYFKLRGETEKGFIYEVSYRRRFSKLTDKILLTVKRESGNTFSITIIGSRVEMAIYIRAVGENVNTRIDINATARAEKSGLVKHMLSDIASRIEEFVKENVKKPAAAKPARPVEAKREVGEEKPAVLPLTEFKREGIISRPAGVEKPPAGKPAAPPAKPPTPPPKPSRPVKPEISLPPREELENKLLDPLWIAQLLMHCSLISRKTMPLPSSPKELIDMASEAIGGEEYPLIMISIRGEDIDSHIIYDPKTHDIKAAKTTIGGILDYKGDEALKKLFEKKQQIMNIKIWGIKKLPQ